jgi:hypothetical protein
MEGMSMKTIEERAAEVLAEWVDVEENLKAIRIVNGEYSARKFPDWSAKLREHIEKGMRDLMEDAAQFLDRQAAGFQVLIDHAPTAIRAEDLKRVKHSIEVVAKEMRKRHGKENTHGDTRIAD